MYIYRKSVVQKKKKHDIQIDVAGTLNKQRGVEAFCEVEHDDLLIVGDAEDPVGQHTAFVLSKPGLRTSRCDSNRT